MIRWQRTKKLSELPKINLLKFIFVRKYLSFYWPVIVKKHESAKWSNDSLKRWHFDFQFYWAMTANDREIDRNCHDMSLDISGQFPAGPGNFRWSRCGGPMWLLFRNRWIHHVMILKRNRGIKYLSDKTQKNTVSRIETVLFNFSLKQRRILLSQVGLI